MAYEIPGFSLTLPAGAADLVQYTAIAVDADGLAVVPAAGGDIVGVIQNKPKAGQAATVMCSGVTILLSAGAVVAGGGVAVDATGAAVPAATGDAVIGTALESAASGEFATVLLRQAAGLAA